MIRLCQKFSQSSWPWARVHTSKGFSPSAMYADMRSAWNPAEQVCWRLIEITCLPFSLGVWVNERPRC